MPVESGGSSTLPLPTGAATAPKQDEQTSLLSLIATAADVPASDVVAAVESLGDNATIAEIVSRLDDDAITQASILAKLTSVDSTLATNLDTPLSVIATNTGNAATSLSALAALISAGSLKVAQQGPVPAGTNVIGHVIVDAANNVAITTSLPAGTAQIGHVVVDSGSALSVTSLPSIPAGSALIGKIEATAVGGGALATQSTLAAIQTLLSGTITITGTVSVSGPVAVTGTFFQATQPVSIAATVNVDTELSAAGPLATETTLVSVQTNTATSASNSSTIATNTGNTATNTNSSASSLSNIAPGIPDALGQAVSSSSMPVVLPVAQSSGEIAQQSTLATRASETTAAATLAAVDTLEAGQATAQTSLSSIATSTGTSATNSGTIATQVTAINTTGAKDASVDQLETLAAAGNASLTDIDGILASVRGTRGATMPAQALATSGVNTAGKLQSPLLDTSGRAISASTDLFGRLRSERTQLVNRGYVVRDGSTTLFSKFEGTGGTVTYNSTNGTYDSTTTTTAGSVAIDIHNKVIHYRESFVFGTTISGRMSTTTATNNRKEWGLTGGLATSAAAILAADGCGFYYEGGILGIFYRSSISGITTPIAQSSWNIDKLDGNGASGFTFTAATALLDLFVYDISLVWLGAHGIRFKIGNQIVHEVDFTAAGSRTQTPYTRIPHMRPYVLNYNNTASVSSAVSTFNRNCLTGYVNTDEDPQTYPFSSQRTAGITLSAAGTTFPAMLLRINSAAPERILLPLVAHVRTTSQDTEWIAYIGKSTDFTITGGAWSTPPNNPDTKIEYNITATAITVGAGAQRVPLGDFIDVSIVENGVLDFSRFISEEHRWVGINGDGVQMIFAIVAVAQTGNNAVATVREFVGVEMG